MEIQNNHILFSFLFFFFFIGGIEVVCGSSHRHHHHHHHHKPTNVGLSKLFVFGDSYADTGNNNKDATSWNEPYGFTFPGKPAGRYSDGHVSTDFLASYMKIKSPIPYKWRNVLINAKGYGMNFAYGGTGVFNTYLPGPNITTQINAFQQLLQSGFYHKSDLIHSVGLVSVSGNDYTTYNVRGGTIQGLPAFISALINQLAMDIERIHQLGVKKVIVYGMSSVECSPTSTAPSYQNCNETTAIAMKYHNSLLQAAVSKLNNQTTEAPFVYLNLHHAFMTAYMIPKHDSGSLMFKTPYKPCCIPESSEYYCGAVDANGVKKYTVCDDPKSSFYWDNVHPTQQGWTAVFSTLQTSFHQIFS